MPRDLSALSALAGLAAACLGVAAADFALPGFTDFAGFVSALGAGAGAGVSDTVGAAGVTEPVALRPDFRRGGETFGELADEEVEDDAWEDLDFMYR
ncbi:hypothetical protein DB346_02680 [Verrucomicrobia bacterium LW23]|nr:hypothetical protein DB346_03975 [Verrucomicrobia bacterium LW23]PTY04354.1 hypothetical protein DB346_02680 [Verrucomicrobia bacterium LW23]